VGAIVPFGSNFNSLITEFGSNFDSLFNAIILPILDRLSVAPAAAYSLRLLRTAYAGFCIRVRRSSDNTEQNIGFVSGVIDTVALLAFVGAGDGFVVTWYDQSVNARDATQATAARQPRIVNAGVLEIQNGKASLFAFSTANLEVSGWGLIPQPFTRNYVVADGGTANGHVVNSFALNPNTANFKNGVGTWNMLAGTTANVGASSASLSVITAIFNSASSSYSADGVTTTHNVGTGGFTGIRLFASSAGGGTPWVGHAAEFTVFASALSTADRQLLEASQKAYYATP